MPPGSPQPGESGPAAGRGERIGGGHGRGVDQSQHGSGDGGADGSAGLRADHLRHVQVGRAGGDAGGGGEGGEEGRGQAGGG